MEVLSFLTLFLVVVLKLVTPLYAHGHVEGAMTGNADGRQNQNQLNLCGLVSNDAIEASKRQYPPRFFQPGSQAQLVYRVTNGDGAGPLDVSFDTTGVGSKFDVKATVVTNVPGNNANLAESKCPTGKFPCDFPLTITVPQDLQCPSGVCVMRVKNPQNFVSCIFVAINRGIPPQFPYGLPGQQFGFPGQQFGFPGQFRQF